MKKGWLVKLPLLVLGPAALLIPVTEDATGAGKPIERAPGIDLSGFSAAPPGSPLELLFIHHSCGGQLFAPVGPDLGASCIYRSHPNGGDLRRKLESEGYVVHEASYDSAIGEDTDIFDWLPKFQSKMTDILRTKHQDEKLTGDTKNQIVVFKSCFPNNGFVGEGTSPGDPKGPELTYWNARATLTAVLDELKKHPEVLFVYVTAPPLAPKRREPAFKWVARKVVGPKRPPLAQSSAVARKFNDWVKAPDGWLANYPEKNVVVFDYYDVLTGDGASNLLAYPTKGGFDSHPSMEGNRRAAELFPALLNRAVRRAGLVKVTAHTEAGDAP